MTDQTAAAADRSELELLSFRVGQQEYSVDIMSVREIRGWTRATPLPHAEPYVRGVINLRGAVLPIIDLSCRLGLGATETTERNVIIVVQLDGQSIGLLVDAVSDILSIPRDDLQAPPDMLSDGAHSFVRALTVIEGRMLRILDLQSAYPQREGAAA
jgi:purine-binding chemotaxis protein CheW